MSASSVGCENTEWCLSTSAIRILIMLAAAVVQRSPGRKPGIAGGTPMRIRLRGTSPSNPRRTLGDSIAGLTGGMNDGLELSLKPSELRPDEVGMCFHALDVRRRRAARGRPAGLCRRLSTSAVCVVVAFARRHAGISWSSSGVGPSSFGPAAVQEWLRRSRRGRTTGRSGRAHRRSSCRRWFAAGASCRSVKACRMRCLKSGRGWAAVTADSASGERSSRPMPSTSVSTPAVTRAISGSRNSGTPGVVCRAMLSQTRARLAFVDSALEQEVSGRVGAVDLESKA